MSEISKSDDVYSYCDIHDGFYIIEKYKNKKTCEYNNTFAQLLGYENFSELSDKDLIQLIHPDDAIKFKLTEKSVSSENPFLTIELRLVKKDGVPIYVQCSIIRTSAENGHERIIHTFSEITGKNSTNHEPEQSLSMLGILTPDINSAIIECIVNLNKSRIISLKINNRNNLAESECMFYDSGFISKLTSYIHPDERQTVAEKISHHSLWTSFIHGNYTKSFECHMIYSDKKYIPVHVTLNLKKDPSTDDVLLTMFANNIDGQIKSSAELIRKSGQNITKGLFTKVPFKLNVDEFFEKKSFNGCLSALYLLDLDGFRRINNSLGYETGDKILQTVADNLGLVSDSAILGHLYGNEFLVFVENLASYDELNITAKKMCDVCKNIKITGIDTGMISGSVGVAFAPLHGTDYETLFKKADNALYNAKCFGKNRYAIYIGTDDNIQTGTQIDSLTKNINLDEFKKEASVAILKNNINYNLYNADIKKFRNFNHYYGYEAGDRILRDISDIIKSYLKPGEFFTRIFADNFLILTIADEPENENRRISSILDKVQNIAELSSHKTFFAIGRVEITNSNRYIEFEHLIDCAVIAHRNAKTAEGNTFVTFNSNMENEGLQKYQILSELKNALKNNEICTYVQPQFDLLRREYVSMEALVRWKHPEKGLLVPDKFIRICEENGFISNIDFFVLEQMCVYIRSRLDEHLHIFPVAVNQSQLTIHEKGYFKRITSLINKYDIPPKYIELEVTESAYVNNIDSTIQILSSLREFGFKISMDDFGAGYSSLNVLKDIPIDILKIDKGFLTRGLTEKKPKEIIKSITNMAHNINVRVVCEGVEFPQQIQFLEEIGCELVQGYLFGKPMPYEELADFIEEYKLSVK